MVFRWYPGGIRTVPRGYPFARPQAPGGDERRGARGVGERARHHAAQHAAHVKEDGEVAGLGGRQLAAANVHRVDVVCRGGAGGTFSDQFSMLGTFRGSAGAISTVWT